MHAPDEDRPAATAAGEVSHEPARSRYVLRLDGEEVSVADYLARDGVLVMHHTATAPAHGGQGHAKRLVTAVLDDVRARGLQVVPRCWFVAQVIDEEPRYGDLVAP